MSYSRWNAGHTPDWYAYMESGGDLMLSRRSSGRSSGRSYRGTVEEVQSMQKHNDFSAVSGYTDYHHGGLRNICYEYLKDREGLAFEMLVDWLVEGAKRAGLHKERGE